MTSAIGQSGDRAMLMGNRAMHICKRAIVLALALGAGSSCALGKSTEPGLTGPSMFGVTVTLAATPDLLPRDGRSISTIVASVRDGSNRPVAGLGLHVAMGIEGYPGTLGSLSAADVTTGSDGNAVVVYTPPLPSQISGEAIIKIIVTPVGTNASNQTSTSATIRLTEVAGGPSVTFTINPDPMAVGEQAVFDARASLPSPGNTIISYQWDFGDGDAVFVAANGPTIQHEYLREGTFTVRLRVVDSSNRSSTASRTIVVVDR